MFIAIYEKEEKEQGFINKANEEGWLIWYCIKTLMNFRNGSKFKREYFNYIEANRPISTEIGEEPEDDSIPYNLENDYITQSMIDTVVEAMEHLGFCEQKVFELYSDNVNISQLARDTGIPRNTLVNIIFKVKQHLKNKINDRTHISYVSGLPANVREVRQLELF